MKNCSYTKNGKKFKNEEEVLDHLNSQEQRIIEPVASVSGNTIFMTEQKDNGKTQPIPYNMIFKDKVQRDTVAGNAMNKVVANNKKVAAANIVNKLTRIIPGINVTIETNFTAKKLGIEDGSKGWIDKRGYHLNIDNITEDTMVHELTELWMYMLKNNNPTAYERVIEMAKEHMKSNPDVVKAILGTYDYNNNDDLAREYVATIAGWHDAGNVHAGLSAVMGADKADSITGNVRDGLKGIVSSIWNNVGRMFNMLSKSTNNSRVSKLDLKTASLGMLIDAISKDAMEGNSFFTREEGERLNNMMRMDSVFNTERYYSKPIINLNRINDINDFDAYFTTSERGYSPDDLYSNPRSKANYYFQKLKVDVTTGQRYIYYSGDKVTFVGRDKSELLPEIEQKLLPLVEKSLNRNLELLNDLFMKSRTKDEFNKNVYLLAEEKSNAFSFKSLNKLYSNSGLSLGYQTIIRYSDLKNSPNTQLRAMYKDKLFEGYDPYIIVHDIDINDPQNITISILDLYPGNLRNRNDEISNKSLLGEFIPNDREFVSRGGTFKNNVLGIRQFKASVMYAHMMKSNPKMKMSNITVATMPNAEITMRSLVSSIEIGRNLNLVGEYLNDYIEDSYVKDLLTDKDIITEEGEIPYYEQLFQYVSDDIKLNNMFTDAYESLKSGRFDKVDMDVLLKAMERRLRVIQDFTTTDIKYDEESKLLAGAIFELKHNRQKKDFIKNVSDMGKVKRTLTTAWNVHDPIVQTVIDVYNKTKTALLQHVKNDIKKMKSARDAYFEKRRTQVADQYVVSTIMNASSKFYETMYHKDKMWYKDKNGNMVQKEFILPWRIHVDENEDATKRQMMNGNISEEIAYGKKVREVIESNSILLIQHQRAQNGEYLTYDEAKVIYESNRASAEFSDKYDTFYVPVIQKSKAEMILKGIKKGFKADDIKNGVNRAISEVSNEYDLFTDVSSEENENAIRSKFSLQMSSINEAMKACGVSLNDNGEYMIFDMNLYENASTNIEAVVNSFILATSRVRYFESMYAPTYNAAQLLLIEKEGKYGINLENTKLFLKEHFRTLAERRSPEENNGKIPKLSKATKIASRMMSNSSLGINIRSGIKGFALSELDSWTAYLAGSIANADEATKTGIGNINPELLTVKAWKGAQVWMMNPSNLWTAYSIARHFQAIEGNEFDIMNSYVYSRYTRNLLNDTVLHMFNQEADKYVRTAAVIAHLMSTGSLDAYVVDDSGEIVYDITKDKKYSNSDGTIKENMNGIIAQIRKDNIETGFQDPEVEQMQMGENFRSMANMKMIVDRWIIGSLSEDVKWQLSNHAFGKLLTTFVTFADEKLFRSGITGSTFDTTLGTSYKTIKDAYGNEHTVAELRQMEGLAQSMMAMYQVCKKLNGPEFKKFWTEASVERKSNIIRFGLKMAFVVMMYSLFKIMIPDEEEDPNLAFATKSYLSYYKFIYHDMFDLYFLYERTIEGRNPIVLFKQLKDITDILIGNKDIKYLLDYIPGKKGTVDFIEDQMRIIDGYANDDPARAYNYKKNKKKEEKEEDGEENNNNN